MTSPLRGVRLVALDLDGTLLPSSKQLSGRAVGVIRDVRAAGIEVTLATGKGWNHTRRYARELGLTAPVVAFEGALVSAAAAPAPLHRRTLAADTVRAVHGAVDGLEVGYFYCDDLGRTRAHRSLESWLPQIRVWDPHVDVTDGAPHAADDAPHSAFSFTLIGRPDAVAAARDRVTALRPGGVEIFHWEFWDGHDQLHVRPAGTDKASGLAHVLGHLGVDRSELLAAGDWLNDVSMLEMAGVAVAPANADARVRAHADHVLPRTCEEDAVAHFLEDALQQL